MSTESRQSMIFHPAANVVLAVSASFAAYMLFVFIIPALHVEWGRSWVDVWFLHEYTPIFLMFFASFGTAIGILGWRAWILYGTPNRRPNDA